MKFFSISNKILATLVPFLILFGLSIGYLSYRTLLSKQKEIIKITSEDGLTALTYSFSDFISGVLSNTINLSKTSDFVVKINPELYDSIIEKHVQAHETEKFDLSYLIHHNQITKNWN